MFLRMLGLLVFASLPIIGTADGGSDRVAPTYEAELRIGLKKSGFEKIRDAWGLTKQKERLDLNLDFLQPSGFALRNKEQPIKLRFMSTPKKLKLQTKMTISSMELDGRQIVAEIKESKKFQADATGNVCLENSFQFAHGFFESILGQIPSRAEMVSASGMLLKAECLRQALQAPGLDETDGLLLPAARSFKERFETSFKGQAHELEVIVGVTRGLDPAGQEAMRYEVEADFEGRLSATSLATFKEFIVAIEDAGIGLDDVDTEAFESFGFAENRYQSAEK